MTVPLNTVSTAEQAAGITTQLVGLVAIAALLSAVGALAYRSVLDERIPRWLGVLAGVSGVALYLGTTPALEAVIREGVEPGEFAVALFNVGALLAGAGGGVLGGVVGDRFGTEVLRWSPTQDIDDDVSRLAQAVGQVTTVSLPNRVEDAAGYDPIPERTKESLEGKNLVFPRALSVDELEVRVEDRLRSDYGVGTVDMEFDDGGNVSYLAVGTRAAGIGATLPPATNAVALRADPGFSASTGDIVQVWEPDSMQRVLTGELRGVADDVVTIAIDAGDTPKVDPTRRYRLVTLPVEDRPDREFASLLRTAPETFSTATVEAGSPLHGLPVGALGLTVIAIRPDGGDPVPFPEGKYRLAPGDLLFVIARPGALRRLETAGEPLDPAVVSEQSASLPADESGPTEAIQTDTSAATEREESTGDDGLPVTEESEEESDGIVSGKADAESFQEIKAQFDEADQGGSDEDGAQTATETSDGSQTGDTTASADTEAESDTTTSFDDLKAEFDSGDADWDGDQPSDTSTTTEAEADGTEDVEIAFEDDEGGDDVDSGANQNEDSDDELVSLEDADISFGDESDGGLGGLEIDEDLQGESEDSLADDIGSLDFEDETEDDIDDLELDDDDGLFSDAEADGDGDDDEDDDGGSSGGGKSFADLKAEFESGDAEWEDDVSDSPGGDMRLDE